MSVYKGENVIAGGSVDTYFVRKPAWSQAVVITTLNTVGYTAPKDGIIVGTAGVASGHGFRNISINGVVMLTYGDNVGDYDVPFWLQVNSGDVVAADWGQWGTFKFVPFEDSTIAEPEVVTPELIRNLHDPDWSQAETLTAAQLVAGYTATKRGIAFLTGYASSAEVNVAVNSVQVGSFWPFSSNIARLSNISVSLSIGDVLTVSGSAGNIFGTFNFVPYKAQ